MADYYFAYGSNLNRRQFFRRCPNARPQGRVTLPDYALVFRGVADIIKAPGRRVEGAMYRITPRCEMALDRYEGFPNLYRKEWFVAEIGKGSAAKVVEVMFYVMNDSYISPPSPFYLQTIEVGYSDWKIPAKSLREAVDHAYRSTEAKARPAAAGEIKRDAAA
jgi:gamma-glutamylcyclotransferase (GGCT)/AIG2-like uncharacterized protein YtfP